MEAELEMEEELLVVGGGSNFENGEEGFLRDVHLADALHAAFAFFLFFEEFAFARNVAAVALGENVFADSCNGLAGDHTAADGGLDGDFKHLAGYQLAETRDQVAAALDRELTVNDQRQCIHWLA